MTWWRRRWNILTGRQVLLDELTALARHVVDAELEVLEVRGAAGEEVARARRETANAHRTIHRLLEPAPRGHTPRDPDNPCRKVRMQTKDLAEQLARQVERDNGAPAGTLKPYSCGECPRQPLGGRSYHIGHVAPGQRNRKGAQYRTTRKGSGINRIDPGQLEEIRAKLEGQTS